MTALLASLPEYRDGTPLTVRSGLLTIALINNMPDSAMVATERQFASLLSDASEGLSVCLKLFSWPGIVRGANLRQRIDAHYEDFDTLERDRPDAVIVTGAEPKADRIEKEPLWPLFARLADWTEAERIPVIWSCMSAHAAAFHLGGPHRQRMATKLSGVFRCRTTRRRHALLRNVGSGKHFMPHSRFSTMPCDELDKAGFTILSQGRDTGADVFALSRRAQHLFFQGHPEYGAATLLSEYRRDVARFLYGRQEETPTPPVGYYGRATLSRLAAFEKSARLERNPALLAEFDAISVDLAARHEWSGVATRLYRNWLGVVQHERMPARSGRWRDMISAMSRPVRGAILATPRSAPIAVPAERVVCS